MIAPASRKIGKYEIRHKLGRGGMADVYLAEDTELGSNVALKLIEHSADADTRDAIEAERRGAELQAHLAAIDPRVVRMYGCGDVDGYFYVAMEYIDGQDLAELMRRGPLMMEFCAEVALNVAETLDRAHQLRVAIGGKDFHGIVHGDIKPKNIRIDAHGETRVLDFGIAKALSLSRRLTRNEFGSVPYASPERLDTGEVNALSDLWSLAVMLYEMVTGLRPYQADSTERLERMVRSRIPPPPAPDPCPEPLRRILIKAMAPEHELRYQTAREFANDLLAFREGREVRAATEDLDATRRTFRRSDPDSYETRRTAGAAPGAVDQAASPERVTWPPRKQPGQRAAFGTAMRVTGVVLLAGMLYGAWAIVSDYFLYQHGQQLERDIQSEQVSDPDQIWAKWTELASGNPSSLLLYGPRRTVEQKFLAEADRIIDAYRSDAQRVSEKNWERARSNLSRALALDPDDVVRGKLRLCEGHLARINGSAHHDVAQLNDAVTRFVEARRLLPKSPDPELGLAWVYVYGLQDIDKAYEALQQAERLGHQLGNREKAQLADGYRSRGDRLWWDSRAVRGLPPEKDQIQRAADDYERALQLYRSIAPYGDAYARIARVQQSLESVNTRLQEIASSNGTSRAGDRF